MAGALQLCRRAVLCEQAMERLHATITWADPCATAMFVAACIVGAVLIAALTWPVVQAATLCFLVRLPDTHVS